MMRAAADSAHTPTPCPFCTHLNTHSFTHTAAARLRPLLTRLSPLVQYLPPCPRPRFLAHHRNGGRWIMFLFAASVFTMLLLSYISPYHVGTGSWLAVFGPGSGSARRVCQLMCPRVTSDDGTWQPRAVPMEHSCLSTASLPVSCSPNYTHSELLQLPPIQFLKNYLNPCWHESISSAEGPNPNPYKRNLFSCFSHGALRAFKEMADQNLILQETERNPQRLRCLPHFYIAGMPKCGSTDLFRKVMLHPDVVRPPMKEPHWWGKNRFGSRLQYSTAIPVSDYIDLFDKAAQQIESRLEKSADVTPTEYDATGNELDDVKPDFHPAVTVDASASTFWDNDEWWRLPENCGRTEPLFTSAHYIKRLTPQAKVLVILRNPTERLYSDYLYFTKANKSVKSFHDGVLWSIQKLNECVRQRSLRACVYDKQVANGKAKVRLRVGIYHVYLSEWLKVFPREQLLVLRTEDYSKDMRQATRDVYQFLGLRPLTTQEEKKVEDLPIANTRKLTDKKLGAMFEKTRQTLQDFYTRHNQRLAELLQDDRFLWNDVTLETQPDDVMEGGQNLTKGNNSVIVDAKGVGVDSDGAEKDSVGNGRNEVGDTGNSDTNSDANSDDAPGDVNDESDIGEGVTGGDDAMTDADDGDVTEYAQNGDEDDGDETDDEEEDEYEDSGYIYNDSGYDEEYDEDNEEFDEDTR